MLLWIHWWNVVRQLRPARTRTFLWLAVVLAALTVRSDRLGVTSFLRALGLAAPHYDRRLDFFHSSSLNLKRLTHLWVRLVLQLFSGLLRLHGRLVWVGDGIQVPKSGRQMPAVKKLPQESNSHTQPPYLMGHSCQAVALLAGAWNSFWAVPLAARIHAGLTWSNRDPRTLLDQRVELIASRNLPQPFYFLADAYYASRSVMLGWIGSGNQLISRVRSHAVAYLPLAPSPRKRRGRPRPYGSRSGCVPSGMRPRPCRPPKAPCPVKKACSSVTERSIWGGGPSVCGSDSWPCFIPSQESSCCFAPT